MPPKGSQLARPPAITSKRRRDDDSDDDLSDLSDTPTSHKASESDDDDDEQDDDETSSDSDSPDGEVEDSYASISFHPPPSPGSGSRANMELTGALYSYASEELADSDDDDSEMLELPTKATAKNVAQRAVAGRRAQPQPLSRGQSVSKKRSTATGKKVGSTAATTAREPVSDPRLR